MNNIHHITDRLEDRKTLQARKDYEYPAVIALDTSWRARVLAWFARWFT